MSGAQNRRALIAEDDADLRVLVATARLRTEEGGPPVIFMTAHTRRASLDRALETGPVGCIAKPFELGQLRAQVRRALVA